MIVETPNRFANLDKHTSEMPFQHLLPDALELRYLVTLELGSFGRRLDVDDHVATDSGPVVVQLGTTPHHEPEQRMTVGENADDVAAAEDLTIEPLLRVVAPDCRQCRWGKLVNASRSSRTSSSSLAASGKRGRSYSTLRACCSPPAGAPQPCGCDYNLAFWREGYGDCRGCRRLARSESKVSTRQRVDVCARS